MTNRVMSSASMIVSGGMLTNIEAKVNKNKRNYGQFLMSGNDFSFSVLVFDEEMFNFISRNARKGTKLEVVGKPLGITEGKNGYNPIMTIAASSISPTGNFGKEYVRKQDEKVA